VGKEDKGSEYCPDIVSSLEASASYIQQKVQFIAWKRVLLTIFIQFCLEFIVNPQTT
jgi:hypothetical protein